MASFDECMILKLVSLMEHRGSTAGTIARALIRAAHALVHVSISIFLVPCVSASLCLARASKQQHAVVGVAES